MNRLIRFLGMKNYLHRPAEYCRFIRSRFLNIDAILDAELRLLEHVTGKSGVFFFLSVEKGTLESMLGYFVQNGGPGPMMPMSVQACSEKSVFTLISDDYGSPCGAEYIDFCSGMKILHKKFSDLPLLFLIFISYK